MRSRASARCRPSSVSPPLPIIDSSDIDSDIASCIDPESIELIVTESDSNGFWGLDDLHRAVVCARPSELPVSSVVDDETNFLRQVQVSAARSASLLHLVFSLAIVIIRPRRSRSAAAYSRQTFPWTISRPVCPYVHVRIRTCVGRSVCPVHCE